MLGYPRSIFSVICLSALMLSACGCSGGSKKPTLAKVSGVVKHNGTPVEGATVSFVKEGVARFGIGMTDSSGKYDLTSFEKNDGAVPGTYAVTVVKIKTSGAPFDTTKPAPPQESLLPEKYNDAKTTPLKDIVVKEGSNTINLDVTD